VEGAVTREHTEPLLLDLHLPEGTSFEQPLPAGHNAFLHAYRGAVEVAGVAVPAGPLAVLANDPDRDGVRLRAMAGGARTLLVAGRPLGEPIVQHGPFVMNTPAQIAEAVRDYRQGRFGEG
jgi:redox-sensitive bicupin YhaK (pirin superfamily)